VPPANDESYLPRIIEICRREGVQIIMPGSHMELQVLSQNRDAIRKQTGAFVMASPSDVLARTEDKWELVRQLEAGGFAFPRSALPGDPAGLGIFLSQITFPCVVKDRFGSGSRGFGVANNKWQLDSLVRVTPNPMVQEYLHPDDQEYTVGVFLCSDGKAAASIVMRRELDLGMTFRAQILADSYLGAYCERVAEHLGCMGPCNVQLRLTDRGPVVFEVNPRFSSTTSARPLYGYNDAEMCIRHFVLGHEIERPAIRSGRLYRVIEDVFIEDDAYCRLERFGRVEKDAPSSARPFEP
jgi:carbamoyl-phosphate synthase large subunit